MFPPIFFFLLCEYNNCIGHSSWSIIWALVWQCLFKVIKFSQNLNNNVAYEAYKLHVSVCAIFGCCRLKKWNYFSTNNQKNNRRCIRSYNFIHSRHLSHTENMLDNCLTTFVNCCLTESLLGVFIHSMNFATINAIYLFIFTNLSLSHLKLFETAVIFTMMYGSFEMHFYPSNKIVKQFELFYGN